MACAQPRAFAGHCFAMSAILVAFNGPQAGEWENALRAHAKGRELRIWPDAIGDPATIAYACVWLAPHGLLAGLPNLKADHQSRRRRRSSARRSRLAAGAVGPRRACRPHQAGDRICHAACADASSAAAALRRPAAPSGIWLAHDQPAASEVTVGVMGLGVIGGNVADQLGRLGFKVAGWSRTPEAAHSLAWRPFTARTASMPSWRGRKFWSACCRGRATPKVS